MTRGDGACRVGLAGLGYWGPNLARNFDELAELAWLCDLDQELLGGFAQRYLADVVRHFAGDGSMNS